jgi:hypothetical protein
MIQTIGALALLSLLILNANRAVLSNTRTVYTGQYAVTAVSIAQSYLFEATAKEFDEKTIGQSFLADPTKFSSTLGPDAGETSIGKFNDLDDYQGYSAVVTTPTDPLTTYMVDCTVDYVEEKDFSSVSGTQTFFKRITVSVTIPYSDPSLFGLEDGTPRVKLSSVVSYH